MNNKDIEKCFKDLRLILINHQELFNNQMERENILLDAIKELAEEIDNLHKKNIKIERQISLMSLTKN